LTQDSDTSQLTEVPRLELDAAEWEQAQNLARQCGLACVSLSSLEIDPALIKRVPMEVLETYQMAPIAEADGVITLAMADPLDVMGEDMVRFATGSKVKRVVAPPGEIRRLLKGGAQPTETLLDAILRRIPESGEITYIQSADASAEKQQQESADLEPTAPIIQLVSSIIGDAIRMKASDIHVEPLKHTMRVRYRLDGYLRTIVELPQRVQSSCITRLKIISGLDISESRKPQDGRTRAVLEGREVDMRVSSLPTYFGEKVVLRILDPKAVMVDLQNLGFNAENLESVKQLLACSQGMILCTGPTGSGKTSTLYSALLQLNQESDNVVTVEDPIEYQLEGINQVQVNPRAGVTFASALRSILRQDPDVVLIGEIRDLETAEIAVQSAQTGHLVLSTLHTNDALSTINRLILMGVAPYLLASSLLCVIAQRLVRRLCPKCRQLGQPSETSLALLRAAGIANPPSETYQPKGCEDCNYLGYRGRMGIFEILVVTDRVRQLLLEQVSEAEIERLARSEGMRSLLEDGLQKCQEGLTSLDEVLRVITIRRVGGRRCPHCEASIPPEHPICVFCGTEVLMLCPHCQMTLQPEWHFCPQCRQPVEFSMGPALQPSDSKTAENPLLPEEGLQEEGPPGPVPDVGERINGQSWILLVTGDAVMSAQLSACLLEEDFCVLTADDPEHAITLTHYHMPDLIVLDIDLEGIDASAWISRLRSQLDSSLISVLLLSRLGKDGVEGLDSGADGILVKPFQEARFFGRVQEILQKTPRMTGPAKQALTTPWSAQHLPPVLTDPLRRVLAACHTGHDEVALAELAGLAQRVVQYCYSLTVSALHEGRCLPGIPLWAEPQSWEALTEKASSLPEFTQDLSALCSEMPSLRPMLAMVKVAADSSQELRDLWEVQPASSQWKARVAHGMVLLRPWYEKARAFAAQAEHLLDGPDSQGVICGAVQIGDINLTLDEPALHIYTRFLSG